MLTGLLINRWRSRCPSPACRWTPAVVDDVDVLVLRGLLSGVGVLVVLVVRALTRGLGLLQGHPDVSHGDVLALVLWRGFPCLLVAVIAHSREFVACLDLRHLVCLHLELRAGVTRRSDYQAPLRVGLLSHRRVLRRQLRKLAARLVGLALHLGRASFLTSAIHIFNLLYF